MARTRRLSTRPPRSYLVAYDEPLSSEVSAGPDSALLELARRMRLAEQALHEAMDDLVDAEQRHAATRAKPLRRQPDWLIAAQRRESAAIDSLEAIFQAIVRAPAHTKAGLGIKVQVIANLYGQSADDAQNENDIILSLLTSILADLRTV
jgi:hypothetical protein